MQLTHLSLTNFRNFTRLDLDVPGGVVLLVGDNAQGKTSLLEAIYYLATLVSFHASNDRQLINFLVDRDPLVVARIVADFQYQGGNSDIPDMRIRPERGSAPGFAIATTGTRQHRLEIRLILERNGSGSFHNEIPPLKKEFLLDGVKRKAHDVLGAFNAVLFLPQMLQVIEGAPEERRRYLNLALAQVTPGYSATIAEYTHVLSQRNALLKQLAERIGDPGELNYWDDLLANLGARIMHVRIRAIRELERLTGRIHNQLTHNLETLRIAYHPSYEPVPDRLPGQYPLPLDTPIDRSGIVLERLEQGFRDRLQKLRPEEIARGVTTIGPHRDELRFLSNTIDLGTYGSRGQARTAMLSLKLAEVIWMKEKTGQWPVLLLDEVLAELDPTRRLDLLNRLGGSEQALITTTDFNLFAEEFTRTSTIWHISAGRFTA